LILKIASLVASDRRKLLESPKASSPAYRLLEMLPMMPRFTVERVKTALGTTFPTASAAVKDLEELGLITKRTGNKKNRSFSYNRYIKLLSA
jgi:DNA-binding MarR family transcriptional regulator